MRVFDTHIHYGHSRLEGFEDRLLALHADGVERMCIIGLGQKSGPAWTDVNAQVLELAGRHRFLTPIAYVRPDFDDPGVVDHLYWQGFRALKFIWPKHNYDDAAYYEFYRKADAFKMILLFHTGIINTVPRYLEYGVSTVRMRPDYLETIARHFPNLTVIAAHVGFPYLESCAECARVTPNFYVDLADQPPLAEALLERRLLGGRIPIEKILYASDCLIEEADDKLEKWLEVFERAGLSQDEIQRILWDNAAELYDEGR